MSGKELHPGQGDRTDGQGVRSAGTSDAESRQGIQQGEFVEAGMGYGLSGDVRTVDVHIRRLREKIEANPSEPKYVHTKWGVGYYFQA